MTELVLQTTPREALNRSTFFSGLPMEAREELARSFERHDVPRGATIVREGENGDRFYLIAAGEAEAWTAKGTVPPVESQDDTPWVSDPQRYTLVNRFGPGGGFGEMALLLGGPRRATVAATSDMVLYSLRGEELAHILNKYRGVAVALEEEMLLRAVVTFLGRSSPFASLPMDALRWLALRLQPRSFGAGQVIVRQGEPGDSVYIVRTGRVEAVITQPDGAELQLAIRGPGDAIGEQSLITGEPRAATVRTLEEVEVLRLSKDDLEAVLREHRERGQYFLQLTLQRQRPERIEHWLIEKRSARDGEVVFILKDTVKNRYVKLSEQGAFLWNLMDGQHTVRDLTMAYFGRYGTFGLDAVMGCMMQLQAAGFVHIQRIDAQRFGEIAQLSRLQRIGLKLMPRMIHYVSLPDLDRTVSILYRYVLRPLYSRVAQALLFIIALGGTAVFIHYLTQGGTHTQSGTGARILLVASIVGFAVQGFLHETGHAATCKHFGREVHRAGVGWYLFMPVAFVDTSDMWLSGKWRRATVAFAGPYTNFFVSGFVTLLIPFTTSGTIGTILFQFALTGYVIGLLNLNPLLEFDGYYVLMDTLDVPNLRAKALGFLGAVLWKAGQSVRDPRLRHIFTAYGLMALGYTLFVALSILSGYHRYLQGALNRVMPALLSGLLGWAVAGFMAWLILLRAWRELRKGVRRARQSGKRQTVA